MTLAPDDKKGTSMDCRSWKRVGIVTAMVLGATVASAGIVSNGTNLNGTNLNGTNLNGTNLNGTNLNGTNLNGVSLSGVTLNNVHLDGSQIIARDGDGNTLSGADLIGAQLTGTLDNGNPLTLQIANVQQGAAPNDDIYYYNVNYERGDGSWGSLCVDANGIAAGAIALAGTWNYSSGVAGGGAHTSDPTQLTFACPGGALYKCVAWGYKPWQSVAGTSLAAYHQTCTRVVRADFCGDGTPHTVNGQVINIYDRLGVQQDTQNWLGEASWDENGARAYNLLNRSHLDLIYRLSCRVPLRLIFDSNWEFNHGALIVDETPLGSDL
jgi:hypothetical protein